MNRIVTERYERYITRVHARTDPGGIGGDASPPPAQTIYIIQYSNYIPDYILYILIYFIYHHTLIPIPGWQAYNSQAYIKQQAGRHVYTPKYISTKMITFKGIFLVSG